MDVKFSTKQIIFITGRQALNPQSAAAGTDECLTWKKMIIHSRLWLFWDLLTNELTTKHTCTCSTWSLHTLTSGSISTCVFGKADAKREWQTVSSPSLPATTWAGQLSTPSASPLWPLPHSLHMCLWVLALNAYCLPCFPIYFLQLLSSPPPFTSCTTASVCPSGLY